MAKSKIATAYVQVLPSADGIKGKLSGMFGAEGDSAGASFGSSLIGKVKGLIAAAGIGQAIGKAISSGADLEQSLGGIDTLFKGSADVVKKYANEAFASAGMSANEYMETVTSFSASLISSMGGDTAAAAEAANQALIDMSDNANKMGTDMALIQNAYQGFAKQNYTMLDNLKLGYGGTKTEMERLLADAQKLTGVKYDITNLNDVYSAIHVIQEELGIAGATADEAAGTLAGSFNAMKASFENVVASLALGESISQPLANLQTTVETFLVGNLFPAIGNVFGALPEVFSSGLSMVVKGINAATENLDVIIQTGIDIVTGIGTAIRSTAPQLMEAVGALMEQLLVRILDSLPDICAAGVDLIAEFASGLCSNLPAVTDTITNILVEFVKTIVDHLPEIFEQGSALIWSIISGAVAMTGSLISAAWDLITAFCSEFFSWDWGEIGTSIIDGIYNGIVSGVGSIIEAARQAARSALSSAKKALGINSPSKVMQDEVGKFIPAGIAVGIEANTKPLKDAMHGLSDLTTDAMTAELRMDVATPAVPVSASSGSDSLMLTKLGEMIETIKRLQVVMDTGTLVGELVDPMDDAIAQKLALVERGV